MRLCWNDSFGGPLRNMRIEDAKFVHDIGYRVAGINAGDTEATDADIEHARRIFEEVGLMPGPYGLGATAIRPDKAEQNVQKKKIANALKIAGKLGCTSLRYSVGSMHPKDIWMCHPDNVTQKALDELIESTRDLVPIAEDSNCMLCPETTQWTIVNSIERMKEFVDRLDSPYAKIIFDPVNHMTAQRVYDSGRYIKCAVAYLGDCIGVFHVKDVMVEDKQLVVHIDEAEMGTGLLDHEALLSVSTQLEPWKTFSLEHISKRNLIKKAYGHIQGVANRIGHTWTDPDCTRDNWERGKKR
ncbi:MAG: TIM barrel protein [Candidatus Latescibacteria bacterium]|jgi:sugar phosphate isomerase/epimerase|nr:TIM barrel protein [Candidatus Latescibacterota bacterium]